MSTSDPRWEAFAAREPHFAVLTAPRFLQANLTPEHEREFFLSGEATVAWMLAVIDAGLAPGFAPMTTLEYGCGIGRLALPLAMRPGSVTAVDRSPAMLARARVEADRRELRHITFATPELVLSSDRRFDLVVCYHVLQRMRRREARELISRLCRLIAPGGVGVFQWPYAAAESMAVSASRWVRQRVPGINSVANRVRGKGSDVPFIPTNLLPLASTLRAFDGPAFHGTHVALEHHEGLDYAIAFVEKRAESVPVRRTPRITAVTTASAPDVTSDTDIDAFNQAAELYFASLPDWDHHLAKPFSNLEETPVLLMNLAVVLQALRLTPGMRVLEFGAGSGWLSRFLTQMGCHAIVLDVSQTALEMARSLYQRQPVIGAHPAPEFLLFDGRRIDVADGSLDRIICFDSFHHASNPRATIAEFGRVLAHGGIAAFAEPGPRHAEAPRSQFESQTYGVVERDVDVHDIWRTARMHGFADLRMSVFHGPAFQLPLDDYEQLLAGGTVQESWLASTRKFLRHVRFFSLVKGGDVPADSRSPAGLKCDIRVDAEDAGIISATVTNSGTATWLPSNQLRGGVSLGSHLYDGSGRLVSFDFHVEPLTDPPRAIKPGETVRCRFTLPPLPPGPHRLELDCVAAHVTWFAQAGSKPVALDL
jgi:SAM-dependent methyltransferase